MGNYPENAGANSFAQKLLQMPKFGAGAPCAIEIAPTSDGIFMIRGALIAAWVTTLEITLNARFSFSAGAYKAWFPSN